MYRQSVFAFLKQEACLCGECQRQLKLLNVMASLEGVKLHILYEYNEFLENMLFQFKEGRDLALAEVFFQPFLAKLSDRFRHWTLVLLPSGKEKSLERGFLPLREMLKNCPLPQIEPFYKEKDHKQSLQSFENRKAISQVIKRKPNEWLPDKKLLLIDDVCTSGSTLLWAYHLLQEHTMKIEALVLCAHPRFVESCDEKGLLRRGRFSIL